MLVAGYKSTLNPPTSLLLNQADQVQVPSKPSESIITYILDLIEIPVVQLLVEKTSERGQS